MTDDDALRNRACQSASNRNQQGDIMKTNTSRKAALVLALAVMAAGFTGCTPFFNSTQRTVGPNGEVTTTTFTPSAASQAGEGLNLLSSVGTLARLLGR